MSDVLYCTRCGGRLERREHEGRIREYCTRCRAFQYRNPVPASAAIVTDHEGRVLLVKRGIPPKTGEWCLPGGYIELDEEAHDSCRRELLEETGLHGGNPRLIGVFLSDSPFYHSVLVSAYHLKVEDLSTLRAGDDSTECRFFAVEEMPPIAFRSHLQALQRFWNDSPKGSRSTGAPWGAYLITSADPLRETEAAVRGGIRIVQYRDKSSLKGELYRMAQKLRHITADASVKLIINDHVDLAVAVAADGVHLGQDDLSMEAVRRMVPENMIIGLSTHSREQALDALRRGADYIGCGPIFATPTKAGYQPVGLELLQWVTRNIPLPVVAIGGIDMDNLEQVKGAGAQNAAMVRALSQETSARVDCVNRLLLG